MLIVQLLCVPLAKQLVDGSGRRNSGEDGHVRARIKSRTEKMISVRCSLGSRMSYGCSADCNINFLRGTLGSIIPCVLDLATVLASARQPSSGKTISSLPQPKVIEKFQEDL